MLAATATTAPAARAPALTAGLRMAAAARCRGCGGEAARPATTLTSSASSRSSKRPGGNLRLTAAHDITSASMTGRVRSNSRVRRARCRRTRAVPCRIPSATAASATVRPSTDTSSSTARSPVRKGSAFFRAAPGPSGTRRFSPLGARRRRRRAAGPATRLAARCSRADRRNSAATTLRAIPNSHVRGPPKDPRYRAAASITARNTSAVRSAASSGSATRRATNLGHLVHVRA